MFLFKNKIISLLGLTFLVVSVYFYPGDWMGWFIFAASFYFLDRMNLCNKKKCALLFVLFIHQLIALYYFFAYSGHVTGVDFTIFNLTAKTIAGFNSFSFGTDSALFSNLLALFYKINHSQLFGQELAVSVFMSSCFVLMRLIRYFKLDNYLIAILLMYALMPASLLWTSVILREPFELAFLMLAFECLLYFRSAKCFVLVRLMYLLCAFLLIVCLCLLHKGLFLCAPLFFIVSLLLPLRSDADESISIALINPKSMLQYLFFILLPFFLLLGLVVSKTTNPVDLNDSAVYTGPPIYINNNITSNMTKDLVRKIPTVGIYEALIAYRYGNTYAMTPAELAIVLGANTNYDKDILIPQNLVQFVGLLIRAYADYTFLPAVLVTGQWSLLNLILSLIYLARFVFFCCAVMFCVMCYKRHVNSPILLIILYFLVSGAFSFGTISYGAAMRHNIMTDWILLLLGTPLLYDFLHRLLKKYALRGLNLKMLQRASD